MINRALCDAADTQVYIRTRACVHSRVNVNFTGVYKLMRASIECVKTVGLELIVSNLSQDT